MTTTLMIPICKAGEPNCKEVQVSIGDIFRLADVNFQLHAL